MTNMLQSLRPPKEKRDPLSAPVIGLHVYGKSFTTHMWKGIHRNNEEIINRLGQTEKSAVVEHLLGEGKHGILFGKVKLLTPAFGYNSCLVRELIQIHKHTDNFNKREETLTKFGIPSSKTE